MSGLRSALEEFSSEDLSGLPDVRVEDGFAELQRVSELVELEKARWLAEVARRGIHERDGHVSTTAWLRSRFRLSGGAAREALRVARGLEAMAKGRCSLP
jgi:hypothetical protein